MTARRAALAALAFGASFGSSACSEADQPRAATRYSEASDVPLPYESGSFVLDLWLEGQTKLQVASAGTGRVDVDIEFEDGDRQDLGQWTLVGEVQVRPLHLPGDGSRPARLHFDASPLVRWHGARLLTPVPQPAPRPPHGLGGSLTGRTVVLCLLPQDVSASSAMTELAARGVRFDHCYSQSSWSLPWVTTLFTGLEQEVHAVVEEGRSLGSGITTLPELFQEAEYRTAAFTQVDTLSESAGIRRGFDDWSAFQVDPTESELMLRAVERELDDALDDPRFVYVHFDADSAEVGVSQLWNHATSIGHEKFVFLLAPLAPEPAVQEASATVSLLIAAPGSRLARGRTISELVGTIDIAPTLAELMDLGWFRPSARSRSLAPLLQSGVAPNWPARQLFLSEDYRDRDLRTAIVFGDYKYVRTQASASASDQLYDLERDPAEQSNLADNRSVRTGALRKPAEELVDSDSRRSNARVSRRRTEPQRSGPRRSGRVKPSNSSSCQSRSAARGFTGPGLQAFGCRGVPAPNLSPGRTATIVKSSGFEGRPTAARAMRSRHSAIKARVRSGKRPPTKPATISVVVRLSNRPSVANRIVSRGAS